MMIFHDWYLRSNIVNHDYHILVQLTVALPQPAPKWPQMCDQISQAQFQHGMFHLCDVNKTFQVTVFAAD